MGLSTGLCVGKDAASVPVSVAFQLGVQATQCVQVYSWQFLVDQVFPDVTQSAFAAVPDLFEWWSLYYIQQLFSYLGSLYCYRTVWWVGH